MQPHRRAALAHLALGFAGTLVDGLSALAVVGAGSAVALTGSVLVARTLGLFVTMPLLVLAVLAAAGAKGASRADTLHAAARAAGAAVLTGCVSALAFAAVAVVGSLFGSPSAAALLAATVVAAGQIAFLFATRAAVVDGLDPARAVVRSVQLARASSRGLLLRAGLAATGAVLVVALVALFRAVLPAILLAVLIRSAFAFETSRMFLRLRADVRAPDAPRDRALGRAASARGVEVVEWVLVAVFLAVGVIGGYKVLASAVRTHTSRVADCAGGEACTPTGTGGTGGTGAGGAQAAGGTVDADDGAAGAPPSDELLERLAAADTGAPTTTPPPGGGPLAPPPAPGGVRGALRDGLDYTLGAGHGVLRSAASLGQSITDIVSGTAGAAYYTVTNPVGAANATGRAFSEYGQALWNDPLRTLGAPFINGYNGVTGRFRRDRQACTSGTVFECASDSWQTATDVGSALVGPGTVGRVGTAVARPGQVARPAATAARVEAPRAARVIDTCTAGACARPLQLGDDVLVPRTDGSVTAGRIVEQRPDGRVRVEVRVGDQVGDKVVDPRVLARRREVGETVEFTRSDGLRVSQGTIQERLPDGRVRVAWQEGGQNLERTLHETLVRTVDDPGATVIQMTPARAAAMQRAAGLVQVPVATTGTSAAAAHVAREMARLPPQVLAELERTGFRFVVRPGSVAGELPEALRGQRPRGYPPGSTFEDVRGVYLEERHRAVVGADDVGRLQYQGVVLHEVGHALDRARGYPSRTPDFQAAVAADAGTGPFASPYYRTTAQGGSQATVDAAASEVYAEAIQVYYRDPARLQAQSPNLFAYFRRTEPRPPTVPPS